MTSSHSEGQPFTLSYVVPKPEFQAFTISYKPKLSGKCTDEEGWGYVDTVEDCIKATEDYRTDRNGKYLAFFLGRNVDDSPSQCYMAPESNYEQKVRYAEDVYGTETPQIYDKDCGSLPFYCFCKAVTYITSTTSTATTATTTTTTTTTATTTTTRITTTDGENGHCVACPNGHYSSLKQHTEPECIPQSVDTCSTPGQYLRLGGATQPNACVDCPAGTWKHAGQEFYSATECQAHAECPEGTTVFEPSLKWRSVRRVCTQERTLTFLFPGVADKGFYDHTMQYVAPGVGGTDTPNEEWAKPAYGGTTANNLRQAYYGDKHTYHDYLQIAAKRAITETLLKTSGKDDRSGGGTTCEVCSQPDLWKSESGADYVEHLYPGEWAGAGRGNSGVQTLIAADGGEMRLNTIAIQSSAFVAKQPSQQSLDAVAEKPSLAVNVAESDYWYFLKGHLSPDTAEKFTSPPWLGRTATPKENVIHTARNYGADAAVLTIKIVTSTTSENETIAISRQTATAMNKIALEKYVNGDMLQYQRRELDGKGQELGWYDAFDRKEDANIRFSGLAAGEEAICVPQGASCAGVVDACEEMGTTRASKNGSRRRKQTGNEDNNNEDNNNDVVQDKARNQNDDGYTDNSTDEYDFEDEYHGGDGGGMGNGDESFQDDDVYGRTKTSYKSSLCDFKDLDVGGYGSGMATTKLPIVLRVRKICGPGLECKQQDPDSYGKPSLKPWTCMRPGQRQRSRRHGPDGGGGSGPGGTNSVRVKRDGHKGGDTKPTTQIAIKVALVFPPLKDVSAIDQRDQVLRGDLRSSVRDGCTQFLRGRTTLPLATETERKNANGIRCILSSISEPFDASKAIPNYPIERDYKGDSAFDNGTFTAMGDSDVSTFLPKDMDDSALERGASYAVFVRILITSVDGIEACDEKGASLTAFNIFMLNTLAQDSLVQKFSIKNRFFLTFPGIESAGLYDTRMQLDNSRATLGMVYNQATTDEWDQYCNNDEMGNFVRADSTDAINSRASGSPCNGRQNILRDAVLASVAQHYAAGLRYGSVYAITAVSTYYRSEPVLDLVGKDDAIRPQEAAWAANYGADAAYFEVTVHGIPSEAASGLQYAAVAAINQDAIARYGLGEPKPGQQVQETTRPRLAGSGEFWASEEHGIVHTHNNGWARTTLPKPRQPLCAGRGGLCRVLTTDGPVPFNKYQVARQPVSLNETMFLGGRDPDGVWQKGLRVNVNGLYVRSVCNENEVCTPFSQDMTTDENNAITAHASQCATAKECAGNDACDASCKPAFIFMIRPTGMHDSVNNTSMKWLSVSEVVSVTKEVIATQFTKLPGLSDGKLRESNFQLTEAAVSVAIFTMYGDAATFSEMGGIDDDVIDLSRPGLMLKATVTMPATATGEQADKDPSPPRDTILVTANELLIETLQKRATLMPEPTPAPLSAPNILGDALNLVEAAQVSGTAKTTQAAVDTVVHTAMDAMQQMMDRMLAKQAQPSAKGVVAIVRPSKTEIYGDSDNLVKVISSLFDVPDADGAISRYDGAELETMVESITSSFSDALQAGETIGTHASNAAIMLASVPADAEFTLDQSKWNQIQSASSASFSPATMAKGGAQLPGNSSLPRPDQTLNFTGIALTVPPYSQLADALDLGDGASQGLSIVLYKDATAFSKNATGMLAPVAASKVLTVKLGSANLVGTKFAENASSFTFTLPFEIDSLRAEATNASTITQADLAQQFIETATCMYHIPDDLGRIQEGLAEKAGSWDSEGCVKDSIGLDEAGFPANVTCTCNHLTSFAVLLDTSKSTYASRALDTLSLVGAITSAAFLLLIIVAYATHPEARSAAKKVLLGLSTAMFGSMLMFVIAHQYTDEGTEDDASCIASGVMLHLFLLSSFCWMLCEGIQLYFDFVVVIGHDDHWKRMTLFSTVVPLVSVGTTLLIDVNLYGNKGGICWIQDDTAFYAAFVGPAFTIMFANLIIFIVVMRNIITMESKDRKAQLKRNILASVTFFALMGLAWVLVIFLHIKSDNVTGDNEDAAIHYIFAIANGFSGVWLFFLQCFKDAKLRAVFGQRWFSASKSSNLSFGKKRARGAGGTGGASPGGKTGPSGLPLMDRGGKSNAMTPSTGGDSVALEMSVSTQEPGDGSNGGGVGNDGELSRLAGDNSARGSFAYMQETELGVRTRFSMADVQETELGLDDLPDLSRTDSRKLDFTDGTTSQATRSSLDSSLTDVGGVGGQNVDRASSGYLTTLPADDASDAGEGSGNQLATAASPPPALAADASDAGDGPSYQLATATSLDDATKDTHLVVMEEDGV